VHTEFQWGNLLGKRPFGRSRRRWESSIKIALRDIGYEGVRSIELPQNRVQ
jgi:hypothetical protein